MASNGDTAAAPKHSRRSVSRIVPAIPLKFSRPKPPVRPITPEDTATETVTQHTSEPRPGVEVDGQENIIEAPPTPQSRPSGVENGEAEPRTPASSAGVPDVALDGQGLIDSYNYPP